MPNTPNNPPANPPLAVLPTLTLPAVNGIFKHRESNCFYRVVRTGREVVYARIGDNRPFRLALPVFNDRLLPASTAEIADVLAAEPYLRQQHLPASAINVRNILATILDRPAAAEGIPMQEQPVNASDEPAQPEGLTSPEVDAETEVGLLVEPSEYDTFENLITYADTKGEIQTAVHSITLRPDMERVFQISRIQPISGRCIINMYGLPGVGKTKCAKAIAKSLDKKLYVVDYAQVISKYMGDTAKHIRQAFQRAREHEAILLFDEADSLVSKRQSMDRDCATSINQNRNVLMQELDRFDGIVLMSTNMFTNYDDAILRRINRHVEFKLPDASMLESIYKLHLPSQDRVRNVDYAKVSTASAGLSGGDVLNVCINAMEAAAMSDTNPDNWFVTEEMLLNQVTKVLESKKAHVEKPKKRKPSWVERFLVRQYGGKLAPEVEMDDEEQEKPSDVLKGEGTCGSCS